MAYNGAGAFSLVAGNPVVTGTTITSTWANNTLSDIANNGLSNCLVKDGQQVPSGNIPMGGFRITNIGAATLATDVGGFIASGASAVVRTVQNKERDIVSVKDYGAVGNGIANDTAAFTAAGSVATLVEVHVMAPGTYLLNSNPTPSGTVVWVIHFGVTLTGTGVLPGLIIKYTSVNSTGLSYQHLALGTNTLVAWNGQGTQSQVMNDSILTMAGVTVAADCSAIRGVARQLSVGYPASSAKADLRAGEFQTLRATGIPAGSTWGIEIGVHSEVAGINDGYNVGAFIASSHTGWLPTGVRAGSAIYVKGEDGWTNLINYLDTDSVTSLFRIDQFGNIPVMGGQIKFPAIQNPSANVNTLDDYAEGTWTPVIAGSTTPGVQTYSVQVGRYTKIGRLVFIEGEISLSAKDAATAGNLQITGLPFTVGASGGGNGTSGMGIGNWSFTLTAGYTQIGALPIPSATKLSLQQSGSGAGPLFITATGLLASSNISFSGAYSQ